MALLNRKTVILAKVESTYGTDPTPTGLANAIQAVDATCTPLDARMVERKLIKPHLGGDASLVAASWRKLDFTVEAAGSGAAGTVPAWGPLMKACGFHETVTADTSVAYAPVSDTFSSVTLYFYLDGLLHKLIGARGTVSLDFTREAIPSLKFSFTGRYAAVSDASLPTPTLTAWKTPLPVSAANTPTFSFMGHSGHMHSLSVDVANALVPRALVGGSEEVLITNRKPAGTVLLEHTLVAAHDWFGGAVAGTTGALQLIHGTASGYKVQIDAPAVQMNPPQYQDQDGIVMLSVPFMLLPSSGNDDLTITVL